MAESDFTRYVEARTGSLLRLAYLLAGDAHTAEDLVQETLLRAHRRWDRVSRAGSPDAYVRRILINQHQSWRRRRASTELAVAPAGLPDDAAADTQESLAARDLAWRLLHELPAQQRAVLVLRYYADLRDADIADVLGCAQGTVRSLAARAFAALRRHPDLANYAVPLPTPAPLPEETS
ncbi:MAG TPA: SigE family RNA polymerase sigma factor [Nocardioidaceae bacterium]|nr:SigE family RNA polymerase sigma factor [Nocardioidaceae bacterium]